MAKYDQAPKLYMDGNEKATIKGHKLTGYGTITHTLQSAFACCLGDRDFAMFKIMMFLTTMAKDGSFSVTTKTICDNCNITEPGYIKARKKLVEKGWLSHMIGESITIHYNKILKDYEEYLKGITELYPSNESEKPSYSPSTKPSFDEGITGLYPEGITEFIHNNTKKNTINKDKKEHEIASQEKEIKFKPREKPQPQLLNPDDFLDMA